MNVRDLDDPRSTAGQWLERPDILPPSELMRPLRAKAGSCSCESDGGSLVTSRIFVEGGAV